jgi:pimeloyl-ACP methyl ester carboxylesterase
MPADITEEVRTRYQQTWAKPGAMTGMINWYQATLRSMGCSKGSPIITMPTLILWGQQDPHLSYKMAPLSVNWRFFPSLRCVQNDAFRFDD